ncbi:MAG: MFS transporter [Bacteroidetes bacterium]|nr:MFS transporter [Bacteroidota bacterium]
MKNRPLFILISVFFFWGFVAASNTILIGLFKKNFELTQFQSQLVDFAFYAAYFIGALIYFSISILFGDPLNKVGYKKGLIAGLIISAIGALGFIPAEMDQSFPLMLTSLFTIGLGFALQQIVANPYVIALGEPATGAHRVSLAGGINSFGTTIGPLLLAFAVYGNISGNSSFMESGGKRTSLPVTIERTTGKSEILKLAVIPEENMNRIAEGKNFILVMNKSFDDCKNIYGINNVKFNCGVIFCFTSDSAGDKIIDSLKKSFPGSHLPILRTNMSSGQQLIKEYNRKLKTNVNLEVKFFGVDAVLSPSLILAGAFLLFAFILGISSLPSVTNNENISGDFGALRYPQVWLGMLAIFVYVGTEVTIQSNLPEFMRRMFHREASTTVHFISLYWGSLMIGRWVGALTVFNLKNRMRNILTVFVPMLAYALILLVNYIKGSPMNDLLKYIPFIILVIIGFFLAMEKPARTMLLFALMAAVMITIGIFTSNEWSTYFFVSGGLFCSVMWPCIFSLSIAGLGKYTSQASSLLIMMILGGSLIPPFQGYLSDHATGIHFSYIVPLIGFLYLAFFGWMIRSVLLKQGIDYDKGNAAH